MILIVGDDQIEAAALRRRLRNGSREVVHLSSVDEAKQTLTKTPISLLVLLGHPADFRRLKASLAKKDGAEVPRPFLAFLVLPTEPTPSDVISGYKLGVDMVLKRSDDIAEMLQRFA